MQRFTIKKIYILLIVCLSSAIACEKAGSSDMAADGPQTGAGGSLARFTISGNYLYMVDMHSITVVDITNPASPSKLNEVFAGFDIETIFSYKNKLYLGSANGMYIFSLNDPTKPEKEGEIMHFRACDPVVSNDSVSYVTLRSGGGNCGSNKDVLYVYNVKNAGSIIQAKEITMRSPYGLGLYNSTLYVCEGTYGLVVFDVTKPYEPVKKGEIKDDTFYDVIPYGDVLIAFVEKGVCFFDISDPLQPQLLSKLKNESI
jgi:hypothetical protein